MLLTLRAAALRSRLNGTAPGVPRLSLLDLPLFAREQLGVHGLVLSTDLLVGADRQRLQRVLEAADKAGCPCLVLMESTPQPLADADDAKVQAATDRCLRVAQAAAWLGCSGFSVPIVSPDDEPSMVTAAMNLKPISRRAEKLDLNLCIEPQPGLTQSPDRVTDLLKKIGGFRVGTLPDFVAAGQSADAVQYLRRLVPYASAVTISPDGVGAASASGPGAGGVVAAALARAEASASAGAGGGDAGDKAPEKPKRGRPPKAKTEPAESAGDEKPKKSSKKGSPAAAESAPAAKPVPASGSPLDVAGFAQVLLAVGYEGPIALDFRGPGDPVPALVELRDRLASAISPPKKEPAAGGLNALLAALEGDDGDLADDDAPPEGDEA